MLTPRLRSVLGERNDLGNKLHSHYVYELGAEEQRTAKERFETIADEYTDEALMRIAYDTKTRDLIGLLISLKTEPNWHPVVTRFSRAMSDALARELREQSRIERPADVEDRIMAGLRSLPIFGADDPITITGNGWLKVDYVNLERSPRYDGSFGLWRDTEAILAISFEKNLFVWDYLNVHEPYRGQGVGTRMALACETIAKDLGITRFSVEYPNRTYWTKRMGYEIPKRYRIGREERSSYTLEGYKTI